MKGDMNKRVGSYYATSAVLLACVAIYTRPFGFFLLWPALALLLVALGYFGLGPSIYGKHDGRHPLWARCFYYFILLGHEISRRRYARQCRPWDELIPGLLIGRQLNHFEAERLVNEGTTAVLDLTAEFSEPSVLRNLHYLNIPLLDLTAPSKSERESAEEFISEHIQTGKVYVHCKIGYSRTAAVTGTYLIRAGYATGPQEAIKMLRTARPSIVIRPEAAATLERK